MPILVVEDDKDFACVLGKYLQASGGYEVCLAHSAHMAFEYLGMLKAETAKDIELVLMDVGLPGVDGIEACRRIKNHPPSQDIPIIIITGFDDKNTLEAAFDAGAMDYVIKPFNSASLMARVRSALRLKQEIDTRKQREQELLKLAQQLEVANSQLRQLSVLDSLTGIANRRQFDMKIYQELRRAIRNKAPLSLVMIDVDHFKAYNDIYGHQAGDDCLRRIAATLNMVVKRPADLVARYGGEEFAVILPETEKEGAKMMAETLRQAIELLTIPHPLASQGNSIVTISLGVATLQRPSDSDEFRRLIATADCALYQSKRTGRNQVTVLSI
jgi:diguanylate cyclase (GGDEF)-like protein